MNHFSNISVVPYTELLNGNIGLSTHRGGPIFPNWDQQLEARHCRNNFVPYDALPIDARPIDRINSGIWCGAFCDHFGHQISEFSMRLPRSIGLNSKLPLLYGVRADSGIKSITQTPKYFHDIITWMGGNLEDVVIVSRPTVVTELLVFPQAEVLHGPRPSSDHLARMSAIVEKNIGIPRPSGILYVSRSRFLSGKLAGEAYIENYMSEQGVEVFRPEDLPLKEQLQKYANASHIIFSEGSALHSLQLFGNLSATISVLMRRPDAKMWRHFIEPRATQYCEVNIVSGLLYSYNTFRVPLDALGLSIVSEDKTLAWLRELEISVTSWSSDKFQKTRDLDIRRWLAKEAQQNYHHHESKGYIVEVLRNAGLHHMANEALAMLPDALSLNEACISHYQHSLAHEKNGDLNAALQSINNAINDSTEIAGFHYQKSIWLDRLGKAKEALESALASTELMPSNAEFNAHCAQLAEKVGDISLALECWSRALEIKPDSANYHLQFSLFLARADRIDEAVSAINIAISLDPINKNFWGHRANFFLKNGSHQEALDSIDKAIELAPQEGGFHGMRSICLMRLGKKREALEAARCNVNFFPSSPDARVHLSNVLLSLGELANALAEAEQAVSLREDVERYKEHRDLIIKRMQSV